MAGTKLVVTIDTEEDEWGKYDLPSYKLTNIARLVGLQALFDQFGVRPTYLITQPVAEDPASIDVLAPILERGACEIGAHCHPWNTTPVVEERSARNSMLCNLPSELQMEKLSRLREAIWQRLGVVPTSFRAGRWGFSADVARNIAGLGFRVDSSVTPLMSWSAIDGPDFDRRYPERYRVSLDDLTRTDPASPLSEVPVTTGFHGLIDGAGYRVHRALSRPPLTWLRGRGVAARLGLFRTTWLCPEMTASKDMIDLSNRLLADGATILNLMFHSVTLTAGLTPFVRSREDEDLFVRRIRTYLEYCRSKGIGSATLTAAGTE